MTGKQTAGHALALVTILIWGTTFLSTKVLLRAFRPVEILFLRFALGYAALLAADPHRLRWAGLRKELTFAAAGLCGVTLYYLLENIALTYTLASNVGVVVSAAPFFTAIFNRVLLHGEDRLRPGFFAGFAVAMLGIACISFGGAELHLNPLGDLLALCASVVWALYSVLTRRIGAYGDPAVRTTRRVFAYGLAFMAPALLALDCKPELARLAVPLYAANLLFLGLCASALCFVTWGQAVRILGAVRTSAYIYMVPVVTVLASALLLHERITPIAAAGTALTLAGLFLSEGKGKNHEKMRDGD